MGYLRTCDLPSLVSSPWLPSPPAGLGLATSAPRSASAGLLCIKSSSFPRRVQHLPLFLLPARISTPIYYSRLRSGLVQSKKCLTSTPWRRLCLIRPPTSPRAVVASSPLLLVSGPEPGVARQVKASELSSARSRSSASCDARVVPLPSSLHSPS